jgi:hypothetical protein
MIFMAYGYDFYVFFCEMDMLDFGDLFATY